MSCGANSRSVQLYERANRVLPDGLNRATIEKDPHPIYIESAKGCRVVDVDGKEYLDLANNFTALIHGHGFEPIVRAVQDQVAKGSCFACPTPSEIELADIICERVPAVEHIRFVNTGTEAVMFAIKASRAWTGRAKIAKFEGGYHGGYDWAEVGGASTPENWGEPYPSSTPIYESTPRAVLDDVVVLPFNDLPKTREILELHRGDIAAVMIDVMPSRVGLIPIDAKYAQLLVEFTQRSGALLISDEVLNLRLSYAGASARMNIEPDIVTMGKIIGGGLPIGAVGGSKKVMSLFGSTIERGIAVPQAGTFSANPLSMCAGVAGMAALTKDVFRSLEQLANDAKHDIRSLIDEYRLPMCVTGLGSTFRIHPKKKSPKGYRDTYCSPHERALLTRLTRSFRRDGVLPAAGALCVLSTPMSAGDIEFLVNAFQRFAKEWSSEQ